jgi:hypothetical protein
VTATNVGRGASALLGRASSVRSNTSIVIVIAARPCAAQTPRMRTLALIDFSDSTPSMAAKDIEALVGMSYEELTCCKGVLPRR